jgi:ribosome-associated protein
LAPGSPTSYFVDSRCAALAAEDAAETKKANGTIVLDVRQVTLLADYFVVTGGDSANQVKAIAEAVDEKMSELGYPARSIEGKTEGRWLLLDYGDIIVHVLQDKERFYYKLEQFWNNALVVHR